MHLGLRRAARRLLLARRGDEEDRTVIRRHRQRAIRREGQRADFLLELHARGRSGIITGADSQLGRLRAIDTRQVPRVARECGEAQPVLAGHGLRDLGACAQGNRRAVVALRPPASILAARDVEDVRCICARGDEHCAGGVGPSRVEESQRSAGHGCEHLVGSELQLFHASLESGERAVELLRSFAQCGEERGASREIRHRFKRAFKQRQRRPEFAPSEVKLCLMHLKISIRLLFPRGSLPLRWRAIRLPTTAAPIKSAATITCVRRRCRRCRSASVACRCEASMKSVISFARVLPGCRAEPHGVVERFAGREEISGIAALLFPKRAGGFDAGALLEEFLIVVEPPLRRRPAREQRFVRHGDRLPPGAVRLRDQQARGDHRSDECFASGVGVASSGVARRRIGTVVSPRSVRKATRADSTAPTA